MINFSDLSGITFTAWPEMLAWPYLMLQSWLPYKDIAIAHNPLLLLDLAIFYKVFGIGILQLKVYTWILIACNIYLTYYVASKFWTKKVAILSIFLYLAFCLVYQGNGLWFDLALTPFALLLYLLVRSDHGSQPSGKNYFWAGIVFALGFLTKQTFIYFLIPTIFLILRAGSSKKIIINFISGLTIVFVIFAVVMAKFGILDDYYSWAVEFGIFYLPQADGQVLFPNLKQFLFAFAPFIIFALSFEPLIFLFALVGVMGVYPRWELFHFQPTLPFIAITISSFMFGSKKNIFKIIALILFTWHILIGIDKVIGSETRFYEPQVRSVVNEIKKRNSTEIYIINYWDNIYALTNSQPVTKPLIPYIPWYLNYKVNKESILNDLKVSLPDTLVIGERDSIFSELYLFVDKYYSCKIVEEKVEMCEKN